MTVVAHWCETNERIIMTNRNCTHSIGNLKLLKRLISMVGQIHNIGNDIKNRINRLKSSSLFVFDQEENDVTVQSMIGSDNNRKSILKQSLTTPPQRVIELDSPSPLEVMAIDEIRGVVGSTNKKVRLRDHIKSCIEYFKLVKRRRIEKTAQIQKLYDSVGPLLIKLESLVLATSTGLADKMKFYYKFWEKQALQAIIR